MCLLRVLRYGGVPGRVGGWLNFFTSGCSSPCLNCFASADLLSTILPLGRITFSAGVAKADPADLDAAMASADALLYRAKGAGRDCVLAA